MQISLTRKPWASCSKNVNWDYMKFFLIMIVSIQHLLNWIRVKWGRPRFERWMPKKSHFNFVSASHLWMLSICQPRSQQASLQGKHAGWLAIQKLNMIWLSCIKTCSDTPCLSQIEPYMVDQMFFLLNKDAISFLSHKQKLRIPFIIKSISILWLEIYWWYISY